MTNTDNLIAIQDQGIKEAGAIVWWSLRGPVDTQDIRETLEAAGFDDEWMPALVRPTTIALRAAQAAVSTKRQLVRPLSNRTSWEFVTETVVSNGDDEKLEYTANARIIVTRADGTPTIQIQPATSGDEALAATIAEHLNVFRNLLTATDISNWILWVMNHKVEAVGLRERGGFYFVPNHGLEMWRKVCGVIAAVSDHQMLSMPAMASEDAVEAILIAIRREAALQFSRLDEYLAGKVSSRGLNAWERNINALRLKMAQYADLLGVSLEDLESRSELLLGGVQAARNIRATNEEEAEVEAEVAQ